MFLDPTLGMYFYYLYLNQEYFHLKILTPNMVLNMFNMVSEMITMGNGVWVQGVSGVWVESFLFLFQSLNMSLFYLFICIFDMLIFQSVCYIDFSSGINGLKLSHIQYVFKYIYNRIRNGDIGKWGLSTRCLGRFSRIHYISYPINKILMIHIVDMLFIIFEDIWNPLKWLLIYPIYSELLYFTLPPQTEINDTVYL